MKKRHHFHSLKNRIFYSLGLIVGVMAAGTIGMHLLERMPWMDAFYFMSMIATAQGSATTPATDAGKVYAAFMAFISVSLVLTAIGFLVGPLMGRLFKVGFEKYDDEMDKKS